jgi:hypothetical protein
LTVELLPIGARNIFKVRDWPFNRFDLHQRWGPPRQAVLAYHPRRAGAPVPRPVDQSLEAVEASYEDFRNRSRWTDYATAIEDMMARTATKAAPWYLIPADNKAYGRIAALHILVDRLGKDVLLEPRPIDPGLLKEGAYGRTRRFEKLRLAFECPTNIISDLIHINVTATDSCGKMQVEMPSQPKTLRWTSKCAKSSSEHALARCVCFGQGVRTQKGGAPAGTHFIIGRCPPPRP